MKIATPRLATFSGNYNYVRDGANQSLNRLMGYTLAQGFAVRIYSPTIATPAFEPTGDLVSVPSVAAPGRPEYRLSLGMGRAAKRDLDAFKPDIIHVAAPDALGHAAIRYARAHNLPVIASMHTRFETYPAYYGLGFLEPLVIKALRRFYKKCDAVVAPSHSMAQVLREQGMGENIGIWTRGIERKIFHPQQRDEAWRAAHGFTPEDVVIGYFGRLVLEKGLDVFVQVHDALKARGLAPKVLAVGEGPAREWFTQRVPDAVFTGFVMGQDLGKAVANMDVLLNPSTTEAFGNVTNEVMACGIPVVAVHATGSSDLIQDGVNGRLCPPKDIAALTDALAAYCLDADLRKAHGKAAFTASQAYEWDSVNQAMIDNYHRLLDEYAARRT
jgi:phosphatidylinositol alpha 1,6-mannosyltransferase